MSISELPTYDSLVLLECLRTLLMLMCVLASKGDQGYRNCPASRPFRGIPPGWYSKHRANRLQQLAHASTETSTKTESATWTTVTITTSAGQAATAGPVPSILSPLDPPESGIKPPKIDNGEVIRIIWSMVRKMELTLALDPQRPTRR